MTTLAKVAKRAGVSIATVSKVLSNTPYFTEETRQKVMLAVEELGYVPNLAGRALSTGKTHIIALVFPYVYDTIFTDPLVQHILEGVEAESSSQGYNLLLSTPQVSPSGPDDNYLRLLQSGYIEGVVALDNVPTTSVLAPAREKKIPSVAIGYWEHEFSVVSNDHLGGEQIMEHLIELGHRDIGIITVAEDLNYSISQRMEGLRSACTANGIDFDSLPQQEGDFSIESGATCASKLLEQFPDLTAIIGLNDRMALGAMQKARQMGRTIPDDLSIVGYDDIPNAQYSVPPLTTINQQAPELGRIATRMLFDLINGGQPASVILPTELILRESSAQPKLRYQ
jgi:DNA-binding LacI/PurR family transcriptional regulator